MFNIRQKQDRKFCCTLMQEQKRTKNRFQWNATVNDGK